MTDTRDENMERIDQALEGLAREDAPDRLVQETLDNIGVAPTQDRVRVRRRDQKWAGGIAAAVVAVSALVIALPQIGPYPDLPQMESMMPSPTQAPVPPGLLESLKASTEVSEPAKTNAQMPVLADAERPDDVLRDGDVVSRVPGPAENKAFAFERESERASGVMPRDQAGAATGITSAVVATGSRVAASLASEPGTVPDQNVEDDRRNLEGLARSYPGRYRQEAVPEPKRLISAAKQIAPPGNDRESGGFDENQPASSALEQPTGSGLAERFLDRYRRLDGLAYQPASGYWANTYVPGDPAIRRLEAQLRTRYPEALSTTLEPNVQPFDAPVNAALGVYLHASQAAVQGPSRVQLQVGLKAAERQGGQRMPMNVAVVLDLNGEVDLQLAQQIRALLLAMNEQRQPGDRFSVTVAGVPGGRVIQPDAFRHGTVVSFIERLLGGQSAGDKLHLINAVMTTVDQLVLDDDPDSVLGSSLVMLVTTRNLDLETRENLSLLAHRSAVAGMPWSVVSLGGVNGSDLEPVVLAGQGRLRTLGTAAEAAALVDRELHAASRTVARAVRLRIQLAPGVRLVDVIGSHRLEEPDAERVREAEQSIDQRLSRNWGIAADRDADENGIQIVIPGIAAGESHVVLLDLVVEGPGNVADVRVRFKDLLQMSNGVARAGVALDRADSNRLVQGPLERNLLKNLLAFETSESVRLSARKLAGGDTPAARRELGDAIELIAGLREHVAGWESDAELEADTRRLTRFVSDLDAGEFGRLVVALEYAAYRKLLPATLNEDSP